MRDNNLYWVAKLADGHCWMTQNLDLDIGGANTAPLNSNNTDISTTASGSSIYTDGYTESNGVWTWNPASTAITSKHTISGASVSGWKESYTTPYSAEGGDIYYYTSNSSSDDITYNSLASCTQDGHTEGECKHYHRGNYYNWAATIASNNSSNLSTQYTNATNSICPKGWRLPIVDDRNQATYEFGQLLTYYDVIPTITSSGDGAYTADGFNKIRTEPLWFVRSGRIYNNALGNTAKSGLYWSSTVYGSSDVEFLNFNSSTIWPSFGSSKLLGETVRCLAR